MRLKEDFQPIWDKAAAYGISQIKEEVCHLYELIQLNMCGKGMHTNALEIGAFQGGTGSFLNSIFDDVWSLDLNPYAGTPELPQLCKTIQGNNHDSAVVKMVEALGVEFDVIFIDGDHSYEGVKKDFENYSPFCRKGGMVCFHDIVKSDWHASHNCFVDKFWNEIKNEYPHKEINHTGELDSHHPVIGWVNQIHPATWGGIGVLYL